MDESEQKYEQRRLRLIQLRDERCDGKAATLADRIERSASYVSRMLYAPGKPGRKRIADDMVEVIQNAFGLPRGWLDGLGEESVGERVEFTPEVRLSDAQQMMLSACEGFSPKQFVLLMQAAGWIAEGREIKAGETPNKKPSAAAAKSA